MPSRTVTTPGASSQGSVVRYDKNGQPINTGGSVGGSTSSQTYTPDGWSTVTGYYIPTTTATQSLSPQQQAIFDQTQAAQLNLGTLANTQSAKLNSILNQNFNPLQTAPAAGKAGQFQQYKAAPQLATSYDYGSAADNQKVEDALFSRLNTQLGQDKSSLDAQLANQGIKLGSQAYNSAMANYGQNVNDARTAAILNATQQQAQLAGIANQAAQFGNNATQQNFANQYQVTSGNNQLAGTTFDQQNALRNQYLNEQYAARAQPFQEITSLLSGSQIQNPNFVNTPTNNIPTVDYAGLVNQNYQDQVSAYNQQQAQNQGLLGGLFGLAGKAISLSDKNAKKNIKKVGNLKGQKLYEYNYKGEKPGTPKHTGVMAQEVEKTRPDAVSRRPDGLRQVDYGALFQAGKK